MERRGRNGDIKKDKYAQLIEAKRDVLSDDDMELLFTMHEQPSKVRAARELGISIEELEQRLAVLFPPKQVAERRTKTGETYAKRLTDTALRAILLEHEDLNDDERKLLSALLGSRNQVIAASSLGMNYSDFMSEYKAIRKKHGL
jgi:hypothetical protein